MYNIIDFFIRFKNTLLFLLLLTIALVLTVQTHSYQRSKFVNSANFVTGGLYDWMNDIDVYFDLKKNNKRLIQENRRLRQKMLSVNGRYHDSTFVDSTHYQADYTVYSAQVISNNYSKLDNYILIDRGADDGISEELGVITSNGIVGVVENTSAHYARVISILNTNLAINAQLKKSEHFGTLSWDGKNPNVMQLSDVPRIADVEVGDTIMTNGRSLIFPKGILIGTVKSFKLVEGDNYYLISIELFNDMTSIGNVYIIRNNAQSEIDSLITTDGS